MTYQYNPVRIKKLEKTLLVRWSDGREDEITYEKLRDECPCATCKGESTVLNTYIPIKSPFKPAGFYEINKIVPVGNYAVNLTWKDGHDTGIYSWDILRSLGEKVAEKK